MKNRALIAFVVAAGVGMVAFIVFQISSVSSGGVKMGVSKAEACTDQGRDCLPQIDMLDSEGTVWTAESLQDKVVVVNFWATWCAPCKAEIPDLAHFHDKYKSKDVVLLGLMTDQVADSVLKNFARQTGLNYPVVPVDDELAAAFGYPEALPTTFIYDRSGHLVFERPGAVSEEMLAKKVRSLL